MSTTTRIFSALQRHKWWLLLAVLLLLNAIRYWPVKSNRLAAHGFPGEPPPVDAKGFPQPDAEMLARINAMPAEQKAAVEKRMAEDREFFASIQNLPDGERRQKMQEHFAQNPPPFGPPPGPGGPGGPGSQGGPGGPGGPGDGGAPHIPPPDVRRGMDQQLVNSMRSTGAAQ